ncbi:MAG TPA: GSCFA domain-containing protein [Draconibacterium sp.]|nr:GSCFA domain-containing protein [Draconibacterium sp.]
MSGAKFHTVVDVPKYNWETGYTKKNMFVGSCFTENVGNKMSALKYDVDINPFGILYNPVSVAGGLQILLQQKEFEPKDLIQHNGLWHSFYHHGRFSFSTQKETLEAINTRIKTSTEFLKNTDYLFLTFGTAWIYKFKQNGNPVSNCHKISANEFERVRLTTGEIVDEYISLLKEIRKINPGLTVIFTVSPIRHWKDGAVENQRSKATLLLAIDEIIYQLGEKFCSYFPAYEIVMDELRDYRFYADDMIHISEVAIKHIWAKFEESAIDKESRKISKEIEKIIRAKEHKPSGRNLLEFAGFLEKMLERIYKLEQEFGHLNLQEEKEYFTIRLNETGLDKEQIS